MKVAAGSGLPRLQEHCPERFLCFLTIYHCGLGHLIVPLLSTTQKGFSISPQMAKALLVGQTCVCLLSSWPYSIPELLSSSGK